MVKAAGTVVYLGKGDEGIIQLFSCEAFDALSFNQTESTDDLLPYLTGEMEALVVLVDLDLMMSLNYSHAAKLFATGNRSPMIVLLGHFSTKALELAILGGFDEFVTKPLDKEVLMGLLRKAGRKKHNDHYKPLIWNRDYNVFDIPK